MKYLSVPGQPVRIRRGGELRVAGVPVLVEPQRHVSGHDRAYVADPDGNWIAVVSRG